ncbi:MAG TPA: hypothetical protein VFN52_05605, partial [Acidiferrobacteraceae bacterium]|nr:hypothetical protein [Acidiferrobacteraceae bacterium]
MKKQISKSQFKAKALELFRQVELTGEPLVITDHGEPRLEVRRHHAHTPHPLEVLRNSVVRYDDPLLP